MRSNPRKTITIYDIPALIKEAQLSTMISRNILSGFESTGIWPYNRNIFTELDFMPASVTDRQCPSINEAEQESPNSTPCISLQEIDIEQARTPAASTSSDGQASTMC